MIIPMRCFSCGKPISHVWEEFKERKLNGEDLGKVLDDLGVVRYCCRTQVMGHVDLLEISAKFKKF